MWICKIIAFTQGLRIGQGLQISKFITGQRPRAVRGNELVEGGI